MLEAHRRLLDVKGVEGAEVLILNDPPWNPELMSKGARERLGYVSQSEARGANVPIIKVGPMVEDDEL